MCVDEFHARTQFLIVCNMQENVPSKNRPPLTLNKNQVKLK